MEIKKIFLDMDGVLADFDRGVVELCKLELIGQGKRTPEENMKLWDAVREVGNFYYKLEPMADGLELFRTLYDTYGDQCEILSGVPLPDERIETASDDKLRWVRERLSKEIVCHFCYAYEKQDFCYGPEYILIDDFDNNIKNWEAAGGTGILHKDTASTLKMLAAFTK